MKDQSGKALRVCMFTSVHHPDDVRVFHREACTLADAGHEVTLLVHADFDRAVRQGVELVGLKKPRSRAQRLISGWRFYLMSRRLKADVYHFHDFELLPWGWLLKRTATARVLYDCHENHPETVLERAWLPEKIKPALSRLVRWVEPLLARSLDAVICVVPDQAQRLQRAGCKTVLIRNFPRLEKFAAPAVQLREEQLIYLGGLGMARGARLLVDIMQALKISHPQVRLICLGPFNESWVEAEIKEYARQRQVNSCIHFLPRVPHDAVAEHLRRSRIGLIPWQPVPQMLKICYPNKVFEYMACGLPIVASDLPGLRHLIEPAGCGLLVKPDDVHAHVQAIRHLLDHPRQAQEMGERGIVYVSDHYSWRQESIQLRTLYDRIGKAERTEDICC